MILLESLAFWQKKAADGSQDRRFLPSEDGACIETKRDVYLPMHRRI